MPAAYEVNANGGRTYRSTSARSVASVAAEWAKRGHEPHAYAVLDGEPPYAIRTVRVPVTTARETAKALAAAE